MAQTTASFIESVAWRTCLAVGRPADFAVHDQSLVSRTASGAWGKHRVATVC